VAGVTSHITYAPTKKFYYSRFGCGGLRGEHVVGTGEGKRGTILAFVLGPMKNNNNLRREGRFQTLSMDISQVIWTFYLVRRIIMEEASVATSVLYGGCSMAVRYM
jgi:hypothetical protein